MAPKVAEPPGPATDLLREILEKDRQAIDEMKRVAPWCQPPSDLLDLHRRIECVLGQSPSSVTSRPIPVPGDLLVAAIRALRRSSLHDRLKECAISAALERGESRSYEGDTSAVTAHLNHLLNR
jgi:hypothetical protein